MKVYVVARPKIVVSPLVVRVQGAGGGPARPKSFAGKGLRQQNEASLPILSDCRVRGVTTSTGGLPNVNSKSENFSK